jgi:DNA-binding transcriptional LysR family regulator
MIIPDVASLALFLHAVETRSLTKAAERSHIALAAASRRIASLEEMLGVSLLDRSSRGVKPTPAGTALALHARQILQNVERLNAELAEYSDGNRGRVRLHANTSALTQFLPAQLASFAATFPDIRLELEEQPSLTIVQAVAQGAADIGIIVKGVSTEGLETVLYRTDHLVALVPKSHPLRARKIQFERLLDYDFASLESSTSIHRALLSAAAAASRPLRLRVQVWSFEAMGRMVQAGLGIGILPGSAARLYANALGLRLIPLTDKWAQRDHVVCMRDFKGLPPHARRLVKHLTS